MGDSKKDVPSELDGHDAPGAPRIPRRRLVYAAPVFLASRAMFYKQSPCNKQPGQSLECEFHGMGS
jgi:hypothetical protein